MGQFKIKGVSAQLHVIVPSNLAVIADANALKEAIIAPSAKYAFSC